MKYWYKNIGIILGLSMLFVFQSKVDAQSSLSQKLLTRDSSDFVKKSININTTENYYNPIPYKGGLIYISNKKTKNNPLGFNKIYWLADTSILLTSNDSFAVSKIKFNDDFTAPTSNDNNILTHYTRKRDLNKLNNVERIFSDFNPDGSFTLNDATNEVFYTKISAHKIKGAFRWELWQAQLKGGKLINENRLSVKNDTANYMYPHLTNNGNTLLFSSNKAGGKGGYDIYAFEKKDNVWLVSQEKFNDINTNSNEISPATINSSLAEIFYGSDKVGGMGGYDIYKYSKDKNAIINMGFPLNTINDELALNSLNQNLYATSKREGSVNISLFNYNPVSIKINGRINYAIDSTLVARQKLYITDQDTHKIIDSIMTDDNANFSFVGKPNRNYLISSYNDELIAQHFEIVTNSNTGKAYYQELSFNGISPKHKMDSINKLIAANKELQKLDSLKGSISGNKFIVYYDFDKSLIRKTEEVILDSLIVVLKNNSSKVAVVGAFTDCIGSYKYNYKLSVKRANSVVTYLVKHGITKNRIVGNGYSKNYTITPCITGYAKNKKLQTNNRRSEIVLSDDNKNDWATLEKERGGKFYAIYSAANINKTNRSVVFKSTSEVNKLKVKVKIDTLAAVKFIKPIIKKDTVAIAKVIPSIILPVKKDTVPMTKIIPINKKDTSNTLLKSATVNTTSKVVVINKKDSLVKAFKPSTPLITTAAVSKKETVKVIAQDKNDEGQITKEEIIKALDSLAKLKREQERIVEYLTKRINKKPIDVFVSSDSVTVEIYDNAIHDKDSVSVIYNNRIIVDRQELKVNNPIKFTLKVDKNKKLNELVMVAENLGSEPPNTAVMFITEKSGRRQQVLLSTDMTHNEVVYFIRIGKQ